MSTSAPFVCVYGNFTFCLPPTVYVVCLWQFHVLFTACIFVCEFMALLTCCLSRTVFFVCFSRVIFPLHFPLCVSGPFHVLFIAYSFPLCVFFTCYFHSTVSFVCLCPFSRLFLFFIFYWLQSPLCAKKPFHDLFFAYIFLCVFMALFTYCLLPAVSFLGGNWKALHGHSTVQHLHGALEKRPTRSPWTMRPAVPLSTQVFKSFKSFWKRSVLKSA